MPPHPPPDPPLAYICSMPACKNMKLHYVGGMLACCIYRHVACWHDATACKVCMNVSGISLIPKTGLGMKLSWRIYQIGMMA